MCSPYIKGGLHTPISLTAIDPHNHQARIVGEKPMSLLTWEQRALPMARQGTLYMLRTCCLA